MCVPARAADQSREYSHQPSWKFDSQEKTNHLDLALQKTGSVLKKPSSQNKAISESELFKKKLDPDPTNLPGYRSAIYWLMKSRQDRG